VAGYEGRDAPQLQAALDAAAREASLLTVPRDRIEVAAQRFPGVGDVVVSREFPRSLKVRIIPPRPAAAVVSRKGRSVLVDRDGASIGPAPRSHPHPRIVVAGTPPKPGRRLAAATMPALEFARELDPSVGERIRALRVAPNGRIEGRLKGSGLLIVGSGERPRARAAALAAVLNNLSLDDQAAATYIDITVPDRPAVGFAPYTSVSSQR
jgi:cell division septal protein FtsQ